MSPADRRRLEALVGDRNVAQKHVWCARIVLHSADGIGTNGIMRRTGKSKTCVWRWQERFAQEGYDGLLRDKTRPSRIPPLGPEVAERVVALTLSDPPAEATHWVAAMMAKATGISVSSVQRIWRAHGVAPINPICRRNRSIPGLCRIASPTCARPFELSLPWSVRLSSAARRCILRTLPCDSSLPPYTSEPMKSPS